MLEYKYPYQYKGWCQMKKCMDSKTLHVRIKKIIRQLNAIDKMIDEDIPCEDVLIQVILEGHLNHCVREGIEHGDSEKTIEKFTKAIEQFSRM